MPTETTARRDYDFKTVDGAPSHLDLKAMVPTISVLGVDVAFTFTGAESSISVTPDGAMSIVPKDAALDVQVNTLKKVRWRVRDRTGKQVLFILLRKEL